MKRSLFAAVLALAALGAGLAYQAAVRERDYRALLASGDRALADGQSFGAIEAYSGAIALRPDSMLAHLRRGQAYQRRGELDAAARDFRLAAGLDPTAIRPLAELGDVLYRRRWFARAAETYEQGLGLDNRSAAVTYKLGLARYRAGDVDGALDALRAAVRLDNHEASIYYLLGMCLREKHRAAAARQALERAVALAPGLIPAREQLADLYGAQGRHADQIQQLERLAELDRDHVQRRIAVARARADAGQINRAVVTLRSALERTSNRSAVYAALGRIWLDVAESRDDDAARGKALEALGRAASDQTAPSDVLAAYGRALLGAGETARAERMLQRAIGQAPVDPAALLAYAAIAERQTHVTAARQALIDYEALVGDDPDLAARAAHIAYLSLRLGDPAAAVGWLSRAVSAAPTDVHLLASLADAELRAGDPDAARAALARALERAPDDAGLAALARRLKPRS